MWGLREMMVMRHRISEAPGSEPKVELWTPWGVVRLEDRQVPEREPRKRLPVQRTRPGGSLAVPKRNFKPLA